jgi:hypothetical protein
MQVLSTPMQAATRAQAWLRWILAVDLVVALMREAIEADSVFSQLY